MVDDANFQLAQFEVNKSKSEGGAPAAPMRGVLELEYVYGVELEIPYVDNLDLDDRLKDHSLVAAPTVFGHVTYRPTDWLETSTVLRVQDVIVDAAFPLFRNQV